MGGRVREGRACRGRIPSRSRQARPSRVPCPPGSRSRQARPSHVPCPPGSRSRQARPSHVLCPPGSRSRQARPSRVPCPPGSRSRQARPSHVHSVVRLLCPPHREGRACRGRAPSCSLMPFKNIHLPLIRPLVRMGDQPLSDGVVAHVFPFLRIAFARAQLPVPAIALKQRRRAREGHVREGRACRGRIVRRREGRIRAVPGRDKRGPPMCRVRRGPGRVKRDPPVRRVRAVLGRDKRDPPVCRVRRGPGRDKRDPPVCPSRAQSDRERT